MLCEQINKNCFPGIILSAIIFSLLFISAYTESYTATSYTSKNQQSVMPMITSTSDPSTEVRFDPQTYTFIVERGIGPGYRFNTTIKLYDVTNLFAWQIRVYFNNTLLNATNAYYHPDEPIHKVNHIEVAPVIENDYNETHGYVQHAISAIYPDYVNVTADNYPLGIGICIIEFEILMKPSTGKTLESKLTLNNSDTRLRKDPDTIIPCTKKNGLYSLISANIRVPIDYPTIQEAINAANPNEVVFVHNGSYNENVVINKTLMLIGQDANTVIVNGTSNTAINVSSVNNVIIDGFTITSANYGIYAYNCRNLTVSGNFVIGNTYGIYIHCYAEAAMISYCDNGLITRNRIAMNSFGIYAHSYADQNKQSAKAFSYLTDWIVSLNEITENIYGVYAYAYAEDAYWSPYELGLRSCINNWIMHGNNLTANQYNIFAKSHGGEDGVAHVDFWLIYDNNIHNSSYGIYARSSASGGMYNYGYIDGWLIKNNSFIKNEYSIFAKAIPPYYEAHSSISSWKLSYNNLTKGKIGVLACGGIGQYGASAFCNNWNVYKNWFTSNNGTAILLEQYADEWVISDNFITLNNEGIRICGSSANILRYNQINNNHYNLGIENSFDHEIDESNTINGRPVYYWINEENKSIPADAGYVGLINCFNISIVGLNLSSNYQGIVIVNSINCSICCSTFFKNKYGIYMVSSSLTEIYHNNFIDNELHIFLQDSNVSRWDNGYPSGGNYWSDLTAHDWCRGKYQNETGSDGIVDVSYKIDETNIDHYPLSAPWSSPIRIILPGTRIYRGMNTTACARFQAINLTFTIDFNASWIGYSLDGQANVTITGNITLMDLSYGWHNVIVYANDTSGSMWSSVKVHFAITFVTDVNYDQTVDIDDLVETTWRYGSIPRDPRWNVYADVNRDGIIDIEDVAMVAVDYGKTW